MDDLISSFEKLKLIQSTKKKKDGSISWLLVDDEGHEYKVAYESSITGTITWRCNNSEFPNCLGKVVTKGHSRPITVKKMHEHNPSIKTKVKEVNANIRIMSANNPDTQPRKIILECTKGLSEEIVAHLPTYSAARQVCSRARINPYEDFVLYQNLIFIPNPSDLSFVLPEQLENGEKFLFFDEMIGEDRILIFTTEKNLSLLTEYRNWLCDGTFDSAPSLFKQLFSLHALKKNKTLPLVYALFTNKQEATYQKFFDFIKNLTKTGPITISCDFELAIINAIETVFPEANILGCFFHLKKSIWRHIQDNGLVNDYNDLNIIENNIRLYTKMLACLAFVPCEFVISAFTLI